MTDAPRPHRRINEITDQIIGAALRVHSVLGAGVLESTVAACLLHELSESGLHVEHQVGLPIVYGNVVLPAGYRVDFIVERRVIVEIKCVEKILPVHMAQLLSYLRLSGLTLGLLMNFNVPSLRQGIRRVVNGFDEDD